MGWQPGAGNGAGAGPDPGEPDAGAPPVPDPRLAWFASGADGRDALVPSGLLALAAEEVSGPGRRCRAAGADELTGLLRGWAAIESWAAAGKLGVVAEMIRRDDQPRRPGGRHGDLPDEWSPSLRHEVALALSSSVQSAQTTAWLAWEVQARLPGIGAFLNDGTLTLAKARAVIETFQYLADADATAAEALLLDQLAGKTYSQVLRLAEQAALTVDPELAGRRREQAQKRNARVTFFRELSGTAGLSGRDLPPDEALAAMAGVNARAQEYEDSGAFGDTPMDVLRAYAYLDLLRGAPAQERIDCAESLDEAAEIAEALAWADARAARNAARTRTGHPGEPGPEPEPAAPGGSTAGHDGHDDNAGSSARRDDRSGDDPGDDGQLGGDDRDDGPGGPGDPGGPGGPGAGDHGPMPGAAPAGRAVRPRPPDLVVPLLTLLGLAERPGEVQGFGLLDPALARAMAAAAAASPGTEACVTVTSPQGYAIGHGCARQERPSRSARQAGAPGGPAAGLSARLNLTVPAEALAGLAGLAGRAGRAGRAGPWDFTSRASTGPPGGAGPPDGFGTWSLTLPGGRRLVVLLQAVPVEGCDHRYESHGYHPGEKLRHLVQVRDGTCTFPSCNRHARESDFEHAVPFDKGGRTCACNAGARSRACHRVKQTRGWAVRQPRPGWHEWTTPAGRVYTKGPRRYPA